MKRVLLVAVSLALGGMLGGIHAFGQNAPLKLVQTIDMPDVPVGPYTDHLAVDLKGRRLFATPQAHKSVYVFDLDSGKLLHDIAGFGNPHSILYREDLDRVYVTDGGTGELKIFRGTDYAQVGAVRLLPDADSIGYDALTKHVYVTNGGEGAHLDYSLLSDVDTSSAQQVGSTRIATESLEAMALENSGDRIFINLTDKNAIAVVDRKTNTLLTTWPVTKGKHNIAGALDEKHGRLFIGCRNSETTGVVVVFDTNTGRELQSVPIGGWVDYIAFDARTGRVYATSGDTPEKTGAVYVFQEDSDGLLKAAGSVKTASRGKTGLYVPELNRLFVAIPHYGETSAKILVYEVN
jgi:DNA-binding beta-propeller fold protein YncE